MTWCTWEVTLEGNLLYLNVVYLDPYSTCECISTGGLLNDRTSSPTTRRKQLNCKLLRAMKIKSISLTMKMGVNKLVDFTLNCRRRRKRKRKRKRKIYSVSPHDEETCSFKWKWRRKKREKKIRNNWQWVMGHSVTKCSLSWNLSYMKNVECNMKNDMK